MSTTVSGNSSGQEHNKRRKITSDVSKDNESLYKPEIVQPEWLSLPPELQGIDFGKDNIAWDKFQPYSEVPARLTPVGTPPTFSTSSPALCFHLNAVDGRARAGTIHFPNTAPAVPTPRFMPVGTKGTLKGVLPNEIANTKCPMILANTYHLAIQPGTELIDALFGGLPKFMGGVDSKESTIDKFISKETVGQPPKRSTISNSDIANASSSPSKRLYNLLTDSGGFQMVSLAALSVVTENGVIFESPYNKGETITLRPEDSIRCQNEIGADVIMQLDDVISSTSVDEERFRLATFRTLRWYDRCLKAHVKPSTQNLFPIMQGHLDVSKGGLRELCLAGFRHRDRAGSSFDEGKKDGQRRIPGFAIGGLAGGESKDDFWRVVDHACRHLPDDRPRYLMGVGYPLDLVVCTALGVDQYDCVYPTRTARFGVALVDAGQMKLKQHEFALQTDSVIDPDCPCQACTRNVSRGRLHALLKSSNPLAVQLLTQHNVAYMMGLVERMRSAILKGEFSTFVFKFLRTHFPASPSDGKHPIPLWVQEALEAAGINMAHL